MDRKTEQEIYDFLDKIHLEHSSIGQDTNNGKYYIKSLFQTWVYIRDDGKDLKWSLKCALKDLLSLCEDYIQKIDEN